MSSKILEVSVTGGLGNQLFQVFTCLSLATLTGRSPLLNVSSFRNYKDHSLEVTKLFPLIPLSYARPPRLSRTTFREKCLGEDTRVYTHLSKHQQSQAIYLSGYFQSLSYFKSLRYTLTEYLNQQILQECYHSLPISVLQRSTGVHIRRGNKQSHLNKKIYGDLLLESHVEIISRACLDSGQLIIFTDDITYASALIRQLKVPNRVIVSSEFNTYNDSIVDLIAFSLCKRLVISNSTFSLWAAYLSDSSQVFYPTPFYPHPVHPSVISQVFEDRCKPDWLEYPVLYACS